MSVCSGCGGDVLHVAVSPRQRLCVDATPDPTGNVTMRGDTVDGMPLVVYHPPVEQPSLFTGDHVEPRYRLHTCAVEGAA